MPKCLFSKGNTNLDRPIFLPPPVSALEKAQPVETITVQGFKITRNSAIDTEELTPVVQPYVGQTVGLAELQQAADLLTNEYRKRGYTIAKAYMPQQEIRDGVVEIAVLEGKVGEITVKGNEHYSDDVIRSRFSPVFTGAGPGLRVNLPYYETALRFDIGFPIEPPKALGGSSPTFYSRVTARF